MKRCTRGGQQRGSPYSRAAPVCIAVRGCRCCCDAVLLLRLQHADLGHGLKALCAAL